MNHNTNGSRKMVTGLSIPEGVLQAIPVAMYITDLDGVIQFYNEKAVELWGRRPAIGDTEGRFCGAYRIYYLDGRFMPHACCPMADALRTGQPQRNRSALFERPDGTRTPALINITLLQDSTGCPVGAMNVLVDISNWNPTGILDRVIQERSQSLAQVRFLQGLSAAALAMTSARSIEEVLQVITDEARQIIGAHQAYTSCSPDGNWEHAIHAPSFSEKNSAFSGSDLSFDGELLQTIAGGIERTVRCSEGELKAHPIGQLLLSYKTNGHRPALRGWLAVPFQDLRGNTFGLIQLSDKAEGEFTNLDETILVQLAQMASASLLIRMSATERHKALEFNIETAAYPVFWISPAQGFRLIYANAAAVRHFGYSREELLRSHIPDWAPAFQLRDCEAFWTQLKKEGSIHFEDNHRRKDGTMVPVEVHANYFNYNGEEYSTGYFRDISERKRAEQALRDSERSLQQNNRMLAALSHIQSRLISEGDSATAFADILGMFLNLTGSSDGFIAEVEPSPDGLPRLNLQARYGYDSAALLAEFRGGEGTNGENGHSSSRTLMALFSTGKPRVFGRNDGAVPDRTFAGFPLHRGMEPIGLVGLGNRGKGYDPELIELVHPCLQTATAMIVKLRNTRARQRAEEALRASEAKYRQLVEDRETLLKEVHHRVKNNLQVVTALLLMEAEGIPDQETKAKFVKCQQRIMVMSRIHESLYQSNDVGRIGFAEYVRKLADDILCWYKTTQTQVRIEARLEPISLTLDRAIPCGLIVNEALSNCLKHAFHHRATGVVRVELSARADGQCVLLIADDGIGMPPLPDRENPGSLGLRMSAILARQLRGTLDIRSQHPGTGVCVVFPLDPRDDEAARS